MVGRWTDFESKCYDKTARYVGEQIVTKCYGISAQ